MFLAYQIFMKKRKEQKLTQFRSYTGSPCIYSSGESQPSG